MVSGEPRMDLLPEEWQALADLEVAARDAVEAMRGPGLVDEAAAREGLRGALAMLDMVRGKAPVGGDRIREDVRESVKVYKDALEKIANHEEHFGSGPADDEMREIAIGALAAGER